uniref:Glycoprotein n=1 Tax=Heterorhabditis bacteriophora TaxID=37862 RepID=A0A1I7X7M0_HETBA
MFCSLNKNSGVKVCVIIAVFMTIYGLVNSYCSTIMRFEENKSRSVEMKTRWTQDDYRFTIENGEWGESLPFHPFENTCKFPLPNTYASDIATWGLSERLRVRNCPVEDFDFASMDNEGAMYVHPHYTEYPNVASDIKCKASVLFTLLIIFCAGQIRHMNYR